MTCIAQTLGTSSRRLMRLCAANGLELYEIQCLRNGVQPFVRREIVEKIVGYGNADTPQEPFKAPKRLAEVCPSTRPDVYLLTDLK